MGQQQSINKNQSKEKLILGEIQTKKGVSFIDKVKAVTTYNTRGTFDILPEHENFISIIKNKIIRIRLSLMRKKQVETIVISVRCCDNQFSKEHDISQPSTFQSIYFDIFYSEVED